VARILIIDDDAGLCRMVVEMVTQLGHQSAYASTLEDGLGEVRASQYDAVFLDVNLPDGNGLDILPQFRAQPFPPEVIIITGDGDPDGAELAIKNGAWDYLQKPLSPKNVTLPLSRVLQYRDSLRRVERPPVALKLDGIVGSSPSVRNSFDALAQAASSEANVLITGETGTGKELFAKAIHSNSRRARASFVVVDCAALPESLAESTLFGHEKGSFTGADRSREGLIKQADGGILFLDEVGELSLSLQKAFLRVLQEQMFRPVGARTEEASHFRLVAATNRDLQQMVERGEFRKDLFYRLRGMIVVLSPLRERKEDLKALAIHYTSKLCERYGMGTKGFSPDFFEVLSRYDWPGNVRELIHALDSAICETGPGPILFPKHLPHHIRVRIARDSLRKRAMPKTECCPVLSSFQIYRENALSEIERRYFQELFSLTRGDIKEACRISGLSRSRVYAFIKKHDISRQSIQ
jgi:two-component system NtrC family response regulator